GNQRRFREHDTFIVGQIRKGMHGNRKQCPSPVNNQPRYGGEQHPPVRQGEVNDFVQHYSLSIEDFSISDFRTKLPFVTTCSPDRAPSRMITRSPTVPPVRTGRIVKWSGEVRTKITSCSCICWTESIGTASTGLEAPTNIWASPSISGRSFALRLSNSMRTLRT